MEVKGQPRGVDSLLLPCGSQRSNSAHLAAGAFTAGPFHHTRCNFFKYFYDLVVFSHSGSLIQGQALTLGSNNCNSNLFSCCFFFCSWYLVGFTPGLFVTFQTFLYISLQVFSLFFWFACLFDFDMH